jgi:phosphatidylglycerol---prolipoprotein diacylglyceryl transferase
MYPVLFRIGGFEITSFGVMTALGALAGLWALRHELAARGLSHAVTVGWAGVFGGLLGAKLLYVGEHLGSEPLLILLTSRGGMSWFGGLAGGIGAGVLAIWWHGWPLVPILAAATPGVALGQMFGRIGCFLVGDDYGLPTTLPWGIAFPEGLPPTTVPVHPTQLYEAIFLALLTPALIAWRRHGTGDRVLLARYCLVAGAFRFLLEFWRVNVRVAGNLSVAQWASLALVGLGIWMLARGDASPTR